MDIENIKLSEAQKKYLIKAVDYYLDQFKIIESIENTNSALLKIYELLDDINFKSFKEKAEKGEGTPSCKKGCSFCCNIQVACTEIEVDLIIKYMEDNNISLTDTEKDRLKEQCKFILRKDELKYIQSPHKQCVFLKDNECSIYPVRPLSCRNYFVYNDPKLCDTNNTNEEDRMVEIDFNLECVAIILTILEISNESTLSKFLNKKINAS